MALSGKKVLVTGADGFIGSHLVECLIAEGCSVRALTLYNSFNSWGWLDSLPSDTLKCLEVVPGDIRDPFGIYKAVDRMDLVFHLAALIAIPFSYRNPETYVDTNIKGTLNVLNAVREHGCERLLITSTSEVYGTARYVPIDEKHPLQGQSPYSATKIGADRIAESFFRSFDTPVTIVRPFNTYGPRQSARAVIPTIATQLLAGQREIRLGATHPTRDLVFVRDTAKGFVEIARQPKTIGEEINIATGNEISIGDLASKLITQINPAARVVTDQDRLRPSASEVERLCGSNSKLCELTGWKPQTSLDEGLSQTISWLRQNLGHYKPNIYNV